jgi:alcohol dehydrogenase YqhD (iron-dependent ADH family)
MRFQTPLQTQRFAQFAERVFDIRTGNEEKRASQGIESLCEWFQEIHTPVTITELKIPAEDISKIADNAITLAKVWRLRDYNTEKIERILLNCQ